ncbi:esterase [Craurococcus roseus]|uniref:Esterase n=1 Tax=Craurococcus roseus TaxID=77585 RepID=A0ABP3QT71_9PROT
MKLVAGAAWLLLTALAGPAAAQGARPGGGSAPLAVREIGSMHVGGRVAAVEGLPERETVFSPGAPPLRVAPNGRFHVEQMYALFVKLEAPRARYPLLLWPGGLTGATWETTPDGRPGWQMFFLRAGHDVYVSDAVERGRSGWARFPEVFAGEPVFRTVGEGWALFRIGERSEWDDDAARRVPFPGGRFPIAHWDRFAKQSAPRWTTTDRQIQAAYDAIVQAVCPCVVMAQSQGGNFAFTAALNALDKVRAVIAVEPSGTPGADAQAARVGGVPHSVVWGDRIAEDPFWSRIRGNVERWQERVRAAGGGADTLDLPAAGVTGNSHMLMMDNNSDDAASRVQRWMEAEGLMRD